MGETNCLAKHVLLVREDSCPYEEIKEVLKEHGFSVHVTDTGRAAMEFLRDVRMDIILVGMELPDTSGFELCKKITGNKCLQEIPVILLSRGKTLQSRLRGFMAGAQYYIYKHPNTSDFIEDVVLSIEDILAR